jgi:hypothetical protein
VFEEVEGEIGLGGVEVDAVLGEAESGELPVRGGGLLVGEHDLEEGVPAHRAGGCQGVHQPFERHVLVGVRVQVGLAHPGEQFAEGGVAGEVGAQDQGVDEEADQVVEGGVGASGDRCAEGDVVARAEPAEQHRDGGVEGHEDGAAGGNGEVAEGGVDVGVESEVDGVGRVVVDGGAGTVHGEL